MSNKPIINKEAQVLLKIIRLAICTEPRMYFGQPVVPFSDDIDWKEVIRLSYEHKVSALAVDGLRSSQLDVYNGLTEEQTEELKLLITNWFNDVANLEKEFDYYQQVIQVLCQLFSSHGLKTIILKGVGLAQNYIIPSHRGAGDIDIYLIDENGNSASERGLEIIKESINPKIELKCHHYEFSFKGVTVEIHNNITNAISKSIDEENFRNFLRNTIANELIQCDGYYIPSPTFNAILQIRHIFTHFFWEGVNLRQLVDWGVFVRKHSEAVDWDKVIKTLDNVHHLPLFHSINSFIVNQLKIDERYVPKITIDQKYSDEFIRALFNGQWIESEGLNRIAFYYQNRYKIYLLSGEKWIKPTIRSIKRHLLHNRQNPFFKDRIE